MPITGIEWKSGEGHDIHLLRGGRRAPLRDLLDFTLPDGSTEDAATYLADNADVELDFQASFTNVIDEDSLPPTCTGFGITINFRTGSIRVDPPPTPDPVIHNFLVHATAVDTSDGKEYRTSIRVHLHDKVISAWLTPAILTLRPEVAPRPQTTGVRFSVRAEFDDGTVGELTNHPDLEWRPRVSVEDDGRLIIAVGRGPEDPAVRIEAVLPPDLRDPANPAAPEIVAVGHTKVAVAWESDSKIRTDVVQVRDAWPGILNPEVVPNFLFLCDGYKTEDRPRFEASVRSLLGLMKTSRLTRPFDLLATSMNYYQAFIPSTEHGISVRCEVYPEQAADGTVKLDAQGVAELFCVPDAKDPAPGRRWTLANVIFRLGLPVPGQGLDGTVQETRNYWDTVVSDVPQARISDGTVRAWQKLARRTFLEETDSPLGLAYGEYPAVSRESNDRMIGLNGRRMTRRRLDHVLSRLVDARGNPVGSIWMARADGTRPSSYPLIFIFSSLKWDRGGNYPRGYIAMNVEDRDGIPARPLAGRPTYEIDLTGKITGTISHSRLVRGCHEVGHSFGLGDEYSEKGEQPQAEEIDEDHGNLQKQSDLEVPLPAGERPTHDVHGDRIKWRWHRIRKAAVLAAPIAEVGSGTFRVPVVLGQASQFAVGDTVLLRVRRFPRPLPRDPHVSGHLTIVGIADPGGAADPASPTGPANPLVGAVMVAAATGHTFDRADAARFDIGCILYLPVKAATSALADDYPFAELIAKNIKDHITRRKRALNQDPARAEICVADEDDIQKPVKLDVDLPFCFKHKNRIVGLFSGGNTYHCGIYHPTGSCIMRNSNSSGKEFCAVCRYLLVDIIDPFKHFSIDLDYGRIYPQP